jgi:predicted GNAT family acetyltransferase
MEQDGNTAHPLDEVVWNALSGKQKRFALGNDRARRYPPAVAPFAAVVDSSPASFEALRKLIMAHGPVALDTVDAFPSLPGFSIIKRGVLLQMIWQGEVDPSHSWQHVRLTDDDVPDMISLTTATQPGPYGPQTIELGNYIGVRRQGRLAAMAGERMKLDGYTEVSAICVDDDFRGQGHAAGLTKLLIAAIRARGETPFLHALTSNHGAIALYRKLGFVERRAMHLTLLDTATV